MIRQITFLGKSGFLLMTFLCGATQAASVLAPVVDVKGSASRTVRGSTITGTLRTGESLAEGCVIRTGTDSRVLFAPVPGIAVSEAKDTSASLLRLSVTKNGSAIQKREAVLRLAPGTLSFSLEKRDTSTTSLAVETPSGTMNARGSVGTVTVMPPCVKVASLSGKITFTPSGPGVNQTTILSESVESAAVLSPNSSVAASGVPITIPPGCFLTICGTGSNAEIRLINTIARTWTNFSADGTELGTRNATVQEMESTRRFFEAALAHASLAVGYGLFSAEGAAEITQTLTMINQSFATVGLAPVEAPAVGSSHQETNIDAEVTTGSAGFSGGSTNPANTSGEIISRER